MDNVNIFTQGVCEAILETTGCHVTISDCNNIRIAGTGEFQNRIGSHIPRKSAFEKAIKTKKTVVIREPGLDPICKNCEYMKDCEEKYEICTPITYENEVIGVIGIIATTDEQKLFLQSKELAFINYATNMAHLLSIYLGENFLKKRIRTSNVELRTIIERNNNPIICITSTGEIKYINQKALEMLEIKKLEENTNIKSIWGDSVIAKAIRGYPNKEVIVEDETYKTTKGEIKIISSHITKIYENNKLVSIIGNFTDSENIQKSAAIYRESNSQTSFDTLIGDSLIFNKTKEKAKIAANYNSTILITGESGTGKELFARAIHESSKRRDYPFVTINCSAIPETLLESELFGYEGGAFTGASHGGKLGKMEIANRGTFFLDEIGDMNLYLQTKLLRVIQDMTIVRVGGTKPIKLDLRFIAATNKDLEEMVKTGQFREDLYYRINVVPLRLPSLRERKNDIKILAQYFIDLNNRRFSKNIKGFTDEALEIMTEYNWPGNIRELQNVVEYVSNYSSSGFVPVSTLRTRIVDNKKSGKTLEEKVREFERNEILNLMEKYGNTKEGKELTANELGISRASLYRKISDSQN